MFPAKRSDGGFTLLELMIVLLLSVLAVTVIALRMGSGEPNLRLTADSRELASALRYAQGEALMQHLPVAVAINLDQNSYRISGQTKRYQFDQSVKISLTIAEDQFAQGEASIRFFGDGSSTGGRVILQSGNQLRRVDVNWITGAVSISDAAV
jgi:general secretion pathway protein H